MTSDKKFGLLRNLLRAFGLSQEAVDDVVNWIVDLLAGNGSEGQAAKIPQLPYRLRENFLTPAEQTFFSSLRSVVDDRTFVCAKVGLGDIFSVKADDQSHYRIYTNKIDRKHVDFLLCDSATMRPIVGVELDDKSHDRPDRRARDEFVDQVFAAAGLPLVHVRVKRAYNTAELAAQLSSYLDVRQVAAPSKVPAPVAEAASPVCPKCGREMILRTAKSGANAGNQFWGCSGYPTCRSMISMADIQAKSGTLS